MTWRAFVVVAVASAVSAGQAAACDLSGVTGDTKVVVALSARAVEVMRLAGAKGRGADARLAILVAPDAPFSLGSGDVGQPFGAGPAGAHAMAEELKADRFSYFGWDYMSGEVDGCAARKVEVEFTDTADHSKARVEFSFQEGRVVAASGWSRSYTDGLMSGGPAPGRDPKPSAPG